MDSELLARRVVLVADDCPLVRRANAELCRGMGLSVLEAADGHEAIQALHARSDISLVVTDFDMPGASGIDVARAAGPRCQVVLSSIERVGGHESEPNIVRFVPKQGGPQQIADCLRELMAT